MNIKCFEIPNLSFCLIDFRRVLIDCEHAIIEDLHKYDLLEKLNMRNADTKKVLYHHVIYNLCETVMMTRSASKIVVYYNMDNISLQLFKYSTRTQVVNFINTLIKRVSGMLPIKIYSNSEDYDVFVDRCCQDAAERKSRASLVDQHLNDLRDKSFDFEKVKKFADKYQLHYLSRQYFTDMKVKSILFL